MPEIQIDYKNWRGEIRRRSVVPRRVWWGQTEFHPTDQWLVDCWDSENGNERTFALDGVQSLRDGITLLISAQQGIIDRDDLREADVIGQLIDACQAMNHLLAKGRGRTTPDDSPPDIIFQPIANVGEWVITPADGWRPIQLTYGDPPPYCQVVIRKNGVEIVGAGESKAEALADCRRQINEMKEGGLKNGM